MQLKKEVGLFFFCANDIPPNSSLMGAIYDAKKDDDGFLYVQYSGEGIFGSSSSRLTI